MSATDRRVLPYREYGNMIKRKFENASMKDVDSDSLKCLVFVSGLTDPSHSKVRLRLLNQLNRLREIYPAPVLDDLIYECQTSITLRADNRTMESKEVNAAYRRKPANYHPSSSNRGFRQRRARALIRKCTLMDIPQVCTGHRIDRRQADTGADVTMISRKTWEHIGSLTLDRSTILVKTVDGSAMKNLGSFPAAFTTFDRHRRPTKGTGCCYVTESTELLDLEWCIQMHDYQQLREQYNCRLATAAVENARSEVVNRLKSRFAGVFSPGLGLCTKTKAQLFLKPGTRPVYKQKLPVPFASQEAVSNEIDRLVSENVLEPVDHSSWAASIVVVKKANGTIRLCADFSTGLNNALILHQHPLPTVEDQIMDAMIAGLDGVAAYLDDIIVAGRTMDEHRRNLEALFERIHDYGFRVRVEKSHFMMSEIRYLGDIIDKNRRRPDPDKIRAITETPPPKGVAQLRSFLGMVNYFGVFVKDMRQLCARLNALLKKNAPFKWSPDCNDAFEKAKDVLASPLLLTHYNPKQELIVAVDASEYGIGAVILHRFADETKKAISHSSRNLTDTEKKDGQIEKEGLALVYAVRKFHRYLFGRHFTLLTDHKPLLTIFESKKRVPAYCANRLLRWSVILRGYDFKIAYHKTTDFGQVDALPRLIAEQTTSSEAVVIAQAVKDA
ncbi:hypothetical protein OESDEN_01620 [Oesophagostomum dentatum]|uniref:RNA-directed DNA polymerase n=1 Tax=Oesophagostomum dentatum TaxID=61180 RepID=A0A0B1TSJ9_OESDE|nr:hypothetical protein OESDEN_01620 [Oesophagostomum dentatum]